MGRVITIQAVASAGQFVPAREPGSSKGPRRSDAAQAVASAGQFVSAREPSEAFGDCTSCSIGETVRACQGTQVE